MAHAAGGNAMEGAHLFEQRCSGCHVAAALAGKGHAIVRDLRHLDPRMFPVGLLSAQEVADLAAYLNRIVHSGP